ncbi:hypothetical protein ACIQRE_28930 [Streptomyces griseoluteus]|uniref:hypothetical protein n=1 Tax=Streptomyces griseoluteus TaxID=29306 RepID=UPI0038050750
MARDTAAAEAELDGITFPALTLLSLTTPFLQLTDARARGFAEDELAIVLTEFDSSSWDVRAVDGALHSGRSVEPVRSRRSS